MAKSIFQFKNITTGEPAHIIVEGTIYSLVNAQGLPVCADETEMHSSPFMPIVVQTAKKLGYKLSGIQHMEVVFEVVVRDAVSQIDSVIDAVGEQIEMVADFIESQIDSVIEKQETTGDKHQSEINDMKKIVEKSFKMTYALQTRMEAIIARVEKITDSMYDAELSVMCIDMQTPLNALITMIDDRTGEEVCTDTLKSFLEVNKEDSGVIAALRVLQNGGESRISVASPQGGSYTLILVDMDQ